MTSAGRKSGMRFRGPLLPMGSTMLEPHGLKRPRPEPQEGKQGSNAVNASICSFTHRFDCMRGVFAATGCDRSDRTAARVISGDTPAQCERPAAAPASQPPVEAQMQSPNTASAAAPADTGAPPVGPQIDGFPGEAAVAPGDGVLGGASSKPSPPASWFPSIALLGCDVLDGVVGDVVLDVRLYGRFLSQHPETFDDAAERLLNNGADGGCSSAASNRVVDDALEVFVWVVAAERGYEVVPRDVPRIPFLCALLSVPTVRKCLVHLPQLLRLIGCLVGPAALHPPAACYDLALVDDLLDPWRRYDGVALLASTGHCQSLFDKLRCLVDAPEWSRWAMIIDAHQRRAGAPLASVELGRRLDEVERQLRIVGHAFALAQERIELHVASYAVSPTPAPVAETVQPGGRGCASDLSSCPLMVDTFVEWQCVRMMLTGVFVDMATTDDAMLRLHRELESCAGRFVEWLCRHMRQRLEATPTAAAPFLVPPTMDDVLGDMQPVMALMYLTAVAESPTGPEETTGLRISTAVSVTDAVEALERLASAPSTTPGAVDCAAPAADFLRVMSLKRCASDVASFVQKFSVPWGEPHATQGAAAHYATRRIFPTWTHKAATTGRIFASRPNVQTLPKTTRDRWLLAAPLLAPEETTAAWTPPLIRQLLCGPPGTVLLALDYAQVELRILAHLSNDQALLDLFDNAAPVVGSTTPEVSPVANHHTPSDRDVFVQIARILFPLAQAYDHRTGAATTPGSANASANAQAERGHLPSSSSSSCCKPQTDAVVAAQRRCAKTLVYSILYGMSAEGVHQLLLHDPALAALCLDNGAEQNLHGVVDRFFHAFRGVELYLRHVRSVAQREGSVKGVFRTRWVTPPPVAGGSAAMRRFDREVVSVAVQGSASDVLKLAIHKIDCLLPTLHDFTASAPSQNSKLRADLPPGPAVLLYAAHDELVYAVPECVAEAMGAWLQIQMADVGQQLRLRVPLAVKRTVEKHL